MDENSQTHKDNLAYIVKSLENKPITAELVRKMLEFNATSLTQVRVVFPERFLPGVEFEKEHKSNGLALPDNFTPEDLRNFKSLVVACYRE